jgi:hypothetical protein
MTDMTLAMRLLLDSQKWASGLTRAQGGFKGFVQRTRADLRSLRGEFSGLTGQLAGIGLGFSAVTALISSARMDKGLTQIRQTAGATKAEIAQVRGELYRMGRETGNGVEALQAGFGQLIAGGLEVREALPTLDAINQTMAVTGSQATTLAAALQGAQEHFDFDLSKPGMSLKLLDQMTVAGRAGVIEIEDLSGAFASSAANARRAGLTFEQTLALFEGLGTATTKERLGTLVDSTLRLFTNDQYRRAAQKATGVQFYNDDKSQRNPLEVIADIQRAYAKLQTDMDRDRFIARAFGKTDLDTQKGLASALSEGKLGEILSIVQEVEQASGTVARDIPEAIDNAVDATARLKTVLGQAADGFAQPINRALTRGIDFLTGSGEGQLGMSGGQVAGLGTAGLLSALLAKRLGARGIDSLFSRFGGTAAGVAQGKALEAAAGVTPVFVTNADQIGGGISAAVAGAGAGVPGAAGRGVRAAQGLAGASVAGYVGWQAGDAIYENALSNTRAGDGIGLWLTRMMAPYSDESRQALEDEGTGTGKFRQFVGQAVPLYGLIDALVSADRREVMPVEGTIKVEVTDTGTRVRGVTSNQSGVEIQANTGRMMLGGGGR